MDCWYEHGLTFSCIPGCRYCCSVEPGFVFLSLNDLKRIALGTGKTLKETLEQYCIAVPMGDVTHFSLKETQHNDCIFLTPEGCGIYEHRPVQCSTYPFWAHILESPAYWEEEKAWCPGIGQGEVHTEEEIQEALAIRTQNPPVTREEIERILSDA